MFVGPATTRGRAARDAAARAPAVRVDRFNIVYDAGDGFWSGPVVDVSESGLFIDTAHVLPPGTRVTVIPEADPALPLDLRAEVVRVQQLDLEQHADRIPGLALRWLDLSAEQLALVRAFLQEHGSARL